jgi:hypothetical protein
MNNKKYSYCLGNPKPFRNLVIGTGDKDQIDLLLYHNRCGKKGNGCIETESTVK